MRILVVEDEKKIAEALKRGMEQQSYAVDTALDGDAGLAFATTETYDLMILDRMLPGADGLMIVKAVRDRGISTPILLLTAKDKVLDRVDGLNAGADDYLVKPFAFIELLARVRALLRRPVQAGDNVLSYHDLSLDPEALSVVRDGQPLSLTAKEFALLEFMLRNPGKILTKEAIISHVWPYDADVLPNTVEVYIAYLRNKIDKPFSGPALINTRRGFGYYLGEKA